MNYLEEITSNDVPIIPINDRFGTLKGLEQSVNPQLIKYAGETDSLNAHSRQEYRRPIFKVYPFLHEVNYPPYYNNYLQYVVFIIIIYLLKILIIFYVSQSSNYIKQNVLNQPAESISEPYKERFGQRIVIECQAINFRLHLNNDLNNQVIICTYIHKTILLIFQNT